MTLLIIWSLVTALLLLAEHIALWRKPWRLTRPQAYSLGTATIALGYTGWAWSFGVLGAAIALWVVIIVSGIVVSGAYYVRRVLADLDRQAFKAGQVAGPIDQQTIDKGNAYGANESV